MYESFFGLTKLPFKITPDPEFIYWNKDHRRAASIIAFGIEQTVPITVVTGDIGTGKTTLIQQFLEDAPTDTTVGLISNFWSGMGGLYQWILNAYDVDSGGSEVEQFRRFQDFVIDEYAAGRRCVLIVDEAQNVSDPDLEQLRMLTNINSGKDSLLMLFLVGQQQLRDRLMEPQNRQIAQRVGAAFHLGPMSPEDTARYVRHRIKVAGGTREIFNDAALARIHEISGGVPRMINVVCELALVTAFGDGVDTIDAPYVDEFLAEAQANGMIAHLPLQPEAETPPALTPTETPPPPPVPLRSAPRAQKGSQRIRLVSKLEETTEDASLDPVASPAAEKPETEPDRARIMEDAMSATRARPEEAAEPVALAEQAEPEAPEVEDTMVDLVADEVEPDFPEESSEAPLEPEPVDRESHDPTRWVGRAAALVDHTLDAALVLVAVGAAFALMLQNSPGDTSRSNATDPAAPVELAAAAPITPPPVALPDPVEIVPLDDPSGAELLDSALVSGAADPGQAAIDYARAALRGEARAAYYLGQLFETGDGVNRDISLARAWYAVAAEDVRSARRRMADLPEADQGIVLSAPVPLLGGPLETGGAEFVWVSGKGADASHYIVELATSDLSKVRRLPAETLSASRAGLIGDATRWRVIAADPALGLYAVSPWHDLGASAVAPTGPARGILDLIPHVTLHMSGSDAETYTNSLRTAFPAAEIALAEHTTPAALPGVEYAYEADAGLATVLAEAIGGDLPVRRAMPRGVDDAPPLPGEIAVILPGS